MPTDDVNYRRGAKTTRYFVCNVAAGVVLPEGSASAEIGTDYGQNSTGSAFFKISCHLTIRISENRHLAWEQDLTTQHPDYMLKTDYKANFMISTCFALLGPAVEPKS